MVERARGARAAPRPKLLENVTRREEFTEEFRQEQRAVFSRRLSHERIQLWSWRGRKSLPVIRNQQQNEMPFLKKKHLSLHGVGADYRKIIISTD